MDFSALICGAEYCKDLLFVGILGYLINLSCLGVNTEVQ